VNSAEVLELFDGGWLQMGEGVHQARVIVARHQAPEPGKPVTVGKRIGEWIYELFITTVDADGFLSRMFWICIMDEVLSRQCLLMKILKKILIVGVRTQSMGKNSGKSRVNGNLYHRMYMLTTSTTNQFR
jgi:hypothetical protein